MAKGNLEHLSTKDKLKDILFILLIFSLLSKFFSWCIKLEILHFCELFSISIPAWIVTLVSLALTKVFLKLNTSRTYNDEYHNNSNRSGGQVNTTILIMFGMKGIACGV